MSEKPILESPYPETPSESPSPEKPISERKIQANRKNALRSTGPRTARGKRTVSRNAIKHGLLAREVVITAGDGKESQADFDALLNSLRQEHQPVGVTEDLLVQTIANCCWRKARVLRSENGEIRGQLDTLAEDMELANSDKANLPLAVIQTNTPMFDKKNNPANEVSSLERWGAEQSYQIALRNHASGLSYLRSVLYNASWQLGEGFLSQEMRDEIARCFGSWDAVLGYHCAAARLPRDSPTEPPMQDRINAAWEGTPHEPQLADLGREEIRNLIDDRLERISELEKFVSKREKLEVGAAARRNSLPNVDATNKLLRYEAHLDKQLYRAMDQLERLQRQRKGERLPAPININMEGGS